MALARDAQHAGDYSGPHPIILKEGQEARVVWFLLPIHKGADKFDHREEGSGLHGVYEPPWTFRECPDGSLEIGGSIASGLPVYWHGYLREGNTWEQLDS